MLCPLMLQERGRVGNFPMARSRERHALSLGGFLKAHIRCRPRISLFVLPTPDRKHRRQRGHVYELNFPVIDSLSGTALHPDRQRLNKRDIFLDLVLVYSPAPAKRNKDTVSNFERPDFWDNGIGSFEGRESLDCTECFLSGRLESTTKSL